MELDGHIKNTGTSGVNINIELVDPVAMMGPAGEVVTNIEGECEVVSATNNQALTGDSGDEQATVECGLERE